MLEAVVMVVVALAAVVTGVFVVLVIGIRREDSLGSITDRPPGPMAKGTRWILGLSVDHSACRYVNDPQHACPTCRRAYSYPRVH
ncbi:hypothetical protein [Planotetraspora kaengkrachanensis]|uniref:Uncharacterized protein n=1 Tax=Planotetraspora kaengkrachanensis TaxID=575193 RepID=A0A8J3LXF4_9ACTN|nr:hypothetical protein [Planotetraspora kaengkrachanensis]GIG80302.1 hypothetical protein Pka01_34290 [Planotetraspora kaengkrachanensis]